MRKTAAAALVAVLSLPVFGVSPASATDLGTVSQVTNGDNKSTVPSLDSDGDAVAFHSSATNLPGGTTNTANVDDVFSTNPTALPATFTRHTNGDGGERGSFPDISANGQWVVFTSTDAGGGTNEIKRVNVSSGAVSTIALGNNDSGTLLNLPGARVANDGSVVFMSLATGFPGDNENDTVVDNNGTPNTADDVVIEGWDIFHWDNGTVTKLTDGSQPNFLFPDISADGSLVTYESSSTLNTTSTPGGLILGIGDERKVYTNVTAGGSQQLIANGNGRDELPRISDDGSTIVFRSDSTDLAGNNPTPNVLVWTSNGVTRATSEGGPSGITNPDVSGDGSHVVYAFDGEVYRDAIGGGSRIQLSNHGGIPVFIGYPSANVDATKVAFAQSLNNSVQGVEVMLWEEPPPAGAPDAPTGVTAAATGETTASVSFAAAADNGSPISGFTVTASPGGAMATGATSPITVSGLNPNTTYTFTVIATNGVGDSPAGGPSNAVTTNDNTPPPSCGPILSANFQGMSGTDGRIARLYAAYFLRSPDPAGFQFWQARIAAGDWSNDDAATFFSESAEFDALYGSNLSNAAFIDLLYQNVLCRSADAGGEAFWLDLMNSQGWSRGQVALGFSDSAEFRQRTNTN